MPCATAYLCAATSARSENDRITWLRFAFGTDMIGVEVTNDDALTQLRLLHDAIDRRARDVADPNRDRLQCRRGCCSCCVDDLTVFEVEAARIVAAHGELLREGSAHAPGACAFLDADGACRIYADRPYVCRTQGLPLRWFETDTGEAVEVRDICELNVTGVPIEELPESACWEIGPTESALAGLQRTFESSFEESFKGSFESGAGRRVSLRSLFESAPDDTRSDANPPRTSKKRRDARGGRDQ